jgi:hypothetical protein
MIIENFFRDPVGTAVDGLKWGITAPASIAINILGHESSIIHTATGIFRDSSNDAAGELVNEVLHRSPDLIQPETLLETAKVLICGKISELVNVQPMNPLVNDIIKSSLKSFGTAVKLIPSNLLLETSKNILSAVLDAFIATVKKLPLIQDAVFSNDMNAATLGFIWSKGAEFAIWLVDVFECSKCYVSNTSKEWKVPPDNPHGIDNELNFSDLMNLHAIICQLQRLVLSLIFLLEKMGENLNNRENIGMTERTTLATDSNLGQIIHVQLKDVQVGPQGTIKDGKQPFKDEKWLFINGVAGEYHWTRLACEKLAKRFSRDITGILNRGDGIL